MKSNFFNIPEVVSGAEFRDGTTSREKLLLNERLARYKEAVEQRERNRQLEGQAHKKTRGRGL